MAEPIRYHLDEHIDPDIAVALRRYGIDVTSTTQQLLLGQPDEAYLALARPKFRIIVTDDTDLLVAASQSSDHWRIVFCRRTRHNLGGIIRFLVLLHQVCTVEEMKGRVEYPFK